MKTNRIGFGYDVHPLKRGARFVLGGVLIDHNKGAAGHSDADVLIHALVDALLGASGQRDIGHQFPDTDPEWKGADSQILLKKTMQLIRDAGYDLVNMDATICLEEPKIAAYTPNMLDFLSGVMGVDSSRLSIKAKTAERLGFIGAGEGVSAYVVVLLEERGRLERLRDRRDEGTGEREKR